MIKLQIAYNSECSEFVEELKPYLEENYPLVTLETFNEDTIEREKAYKLKYTWGTKQCPFGILIDADKVPIFAFYNENRDCNIDHISQALNQYILYGKR